MRAARFDIVATIPDGHSRRDISAMMQSLLAERFALEIHRERRDYDCYVLVRGKNISRLQPSAADDPPAAHDDSGRSRAADYVKRNLTVVPAPDGTIHFENRAMSMRQMVAFLTPFLSRPVLDMTGLPGSYQVAFDIPVAAFRQMESSAGVVLRPPPDGSSLDGKLDLVPSESADGAILTSVDNLGLKVERHKVPLETIVVDHVEKVPTEIR